MKIKKMLRPETLAGILFLINVLVLGVVMKARAMPSYYGSIADDDINNPNFSNTTSSGKPMFTSMNKNYKSKKMNKDENNNETNYGLLTPISTSTDSTLNKSLPPTNSIFYDFKRTFSPANTDATHPVQTNRFYSLLYIQNAANKTKVDDDPPIYVMPYVIKINSQKKQSYFEVSHSDNVNEKFDDSSAGQSNRIKKITNPFVPSLRLSGVSSNEADGAENGEKSSFELNQFSLSEESIFGITVTLKSADDNISADPKKKSTIEFPLVSGMAYVTAKYKNIIPTIDSKFSITSFEQVGDSSYLIKNSNNESWKIYALDYEGNDYKLNTSDENIDYSFFLDNGEDDDDDDDDHDHIDNDNDNDNDSKNNNNTTGDKTPLEKIKSRGVNVRIVNNFFSKKMFRDYFATLSSSPIVANLSVANQGKTIGNNPLEEKKDVLPKDGSDISNHSALNYSLASIRPHKFYLFQNELGNIQGNIEFNGVLRFVHIQNDPFLYDKYRSKWAESGKLKISQGDVGKFEFIWKTGGKSEAKLLHFAFAHITELLEIIHFYGPCQVTHLYCNAPSKGHMQGIVGDKWVMKVNALPARKLNFFMRRQIKKDFESYIIEDINENVFDDTFRNKYKNKLSYITDLLKSEISQVDVSNEILNKNLLNTGKQLQKLGYMCLMAKELLKSDNPSTKLCVEHLESAWKCILEPNKSSYCINAPRGFSYDKSWGSILFIPEKDEENGAYSNHHYQYGYYVVSAAILLQLNGFASSNSSKNYLINFTETLIRDVFNPNMELDPYFPEFRNFSFFDGHSFSKGLIFSQTGKDVTSVSEDVNFTFGVLMWAKITKNISLLNLSSLVLAYQWRSINQYMLMEDNNVHHPKEFIVNKIVGVFSEGEVSYTSANDSSPEAIHGVHMVPITPAVVKLRNPKFAIEEYRERLKHLDYVWNIKTKNPWTAILSACSLSTHKNKAAYEILKSCEPSKYFPRSFSLLLSLLI